MATFGPNENIEMGILLQRALDERYAQVQTNRRYRYPKKRSVKLSPRRTQVLRLMLDGLTNREIAYVLSISPKTVEGHRDSIVSRVGTGNLALLTRWAIREKIIDP